MMTKHKVLFFQPYPFEVGQKIRIAGSKRQGDWEVVALDDRKMKLRCPVSGREFEWNRFCYFTTEEEVVWPQEG